MKNNNPWFFLGMVFSLLFSLSANAAVLRNLDVSMSGGGLYGEPLPTQARFTFDIGGALYNGEYGGTVFDLLLNPSDAWNSYVVSSGTEFEEAVAFLTNGINDVISWQFETGGTGGPEALFFFGDQTGANGIDLAGAQIDSITLSIDSLILTPRQPGWQDYDFIANVTINGTPPIPEPETSAMMMAGLAGMGVVLRKRRKSGKTDGTGSMFSRNAYAG